MSLGVRRIVTGSVGTRGRQFLFSLNLHDVEAGRVENRVFRLIEGSQDDLIRRSRPAARSCSAQGRARPHPGRHSAHATARGCSIDNAYLGVTPLISGTLLPGAHKVRVEAGRPLPLDVDGRGPLWPGPGHQPERGQPPARRRWPGGVAYSTGVLALTAAATGGFLGILSQVNPGEAAPGSPAWTTSTRRSGWPPAPTPHVITAGALAVISTAMFIVYKDDIFGRTEASSASGTGPRREETDAVDPGDPVGSFSYVYGDCQQPRGPDLPAGSP